MVETGLLSAHRVGVNRCEEAGGEPVLPDKKEYVKAQSLAIKQDQDGFLRATPSS
jgi:hypothetical protein